MTTNFQFVFSIIQRRLPVSQPTARAVAGRRLLLSVLLLAAIGCNPQSDLGDLESDLGQANPPAVVDSEQLSKEPPTKSFDPQQDKSGDSFDSPVTGTGSEKPANERGSMTSGDSQSSNKPMPPGERVDHTDPTSYPATQLAAKQPGEIHMLSWNVESEGADADIVGRELTALNDADRYDIVGLTEVMPADLKKFRLALGMHYKYAYSKSGRNDRMQLLFNEEKFEKIRHFELTDINLRNRYRAPLVAHLKRRTDAVEFLVMVNHLARGRAEVRQEQAKLLVEWARDQTLPVFAIGDYNFDYVFETDSGNPAFAIMLRDNIWQWIPPQPLVDTNWFDNPEQPDGKDDYPGSMLDFAFIAGPAKDWQTACQVIVRPGDFPDDSTTSDHRPFQLIISK